MYGGAEPPSKSVGCKKHSEIVKQDKHVESLMDSFWTWVQFPSGPLIQFTVSLIPLFFRTSYVGIATRCSLMAIFTLNKAYILSLK